MGKQTPKQECNRALNLLTTLSVTQDDIYGTPNSTVNGIDGWSTKAIAGRGILIDYASWAAEQNEDTPYKAMQSHAVTVSDIKAIMAAKNIQPRRGDILILRTGYVEAYKSLDASGKEGIKTANHAFPGLKQGEEMMRWLWEQQFSALAADNPALEVIRKHYRQVLNTSTAQTNVYKYSAGRRKLAHASNFARWLGHSNR